MYSHAATISPALFLSFYYLLYSIGLAGTYMMYNNVYDVIGFVLYYNDTSTVDMFLFLPGYSFTIMWVLFPASTQSSTHVQKSDHYWLKI